MQYNRDSEVLATSDIQRATENAEASVYDYDVFLSFRGPDTRRRFTDVLYDHMSQAGLRVFRDDDELALGDMINKILPAIDNSRLCIPIFSQTFAKSIWCLWEVTRMVELKKEIVPIFYDVTTEDVNLETPVYNKFMAEHVIKFGENEVENWREALKTIATIEGEEVLNTGYTTFCESFVKEILVKIKSRKKFEIDPLIGLEDQVQHALKLLDIHSTGVRYMKIYGMGGIGKTTLAKDIFNKIAGLFDSCSFIEDVRESFRRRGITYLLEKVLNSLNIPTSGRLPEHLTRMMEECFRKKRILIVLDDVDHWEQIRKLAGKSSWFGSGSRIIVTSRNERVMETRDGKLSEEVWSFEMESLGNDNALQLFNLHAFKEGIVATGFEAFSKEVASLTGGLPLALKIIGSFLYNKEKKVWEEVKEKLKEIPESEVKKRLKISYDALTHGQKQIFLDIACFFIGSSRTYPIYMWKECKFCPVSGLDVLSSMSLVKVSDNGKIWMHDQLRDLGRDIVREESINVPARCSRFWKDKIARKVLMSKQDKEFVEALRVEGYCAIDLTKGEIGSLENVRYLELQLANLKGDFESLLPNLRWFSYHSDENFETTNFAMRNLVVLDFSNSTINENWGGWSQLRNARNLKVLDLSRAKQLTRTPHFPEGMILERLILDGCKKLETIDPSIGNLNRLKYLHLDGCVSLTGLPEEVGQLKHLNEVLITGPYQSFNLPESIGNLAELNSLTLQFLQIRELPNSFGKLKSLVELNLQGTEIDNLPDSIEGLVKLQILCLLGCDKVKKLPHTLGSLKSLVTLNLSYSGLVELPPCVGELTGLQHLRLSHCSHMEKLPDSLGSLKSLVELELIFMEIFQLPESIGGLENLKCLYLTNCSKIKALPDTIGDLKSLVKLQLSRTSITKLPESIGGIENLAEISLEHCRQLIMLPKSFGALRKLEELNAESANLSGGLPNEISGLSSLRVLNMSRSQVRELPSSINQLHLLHTLLLFRCDELQELPDLPINLKKLSVISKSLDRVHHLPKLHSLTTLSLSCGPQSYDSDFGISMLSQLVDLQLFHPFITALPYDFGNLAQLKTLRLACPNLKSAPRLPPDLEQMHLSCAKQEMDLPNLLDLKKLSFLEVMDWSGGCTLGFCLPESLRDLYIRDCPKLVSLPAVSHLKNLGTLQLLRCRSLTEVPGLGKLESLLYLHIEHCDSLTKLENLSELREIQNVRITCCRRLSAIEGVDSSKISILGGHSQEMSEDIAHKMISDERHDVSSLLSSPGRDFLIKCNGRQVNIDSLKAKKVCLYLCRQLWATLDSLLGVAYEKLYPRGDFEVVFVSDEENEGSFNRDFHGVPWLAIPFSDFDKRRSLHKFFMAHSDRIPQLLIFDENGTVLTARGFEIILSNIGPELHPFTLETIKELKSRTEGAWKNQSLASIFAYARCDSILPVSELEGKIVAIHFSSSSYPKYNEFNCTLHDVNRELKANGKSFELLWAPIEATIDSYHQIFRTMSTGTLARWIACCFRLFFYFNISTLPTLVIIGTDGKTLQPNAAEAVAEYGARAYPFTPEKIVEAREEEERLAVSACRKFATTNQGDQVSVSDLVGKNILLYFSAQRISRCFAFLPKLIEAYHAIKARDDAFEVIFISCDHDPASFREHFSKMPWLALPFDVERIGLLREVFEVTNIPKLVAIGPTDRIITKEAVSLIAAYGSDAYPFTDEHIGNKAKGWPRKLSHALHDHELVLSRRDYGCDGCNNEGHVWSYSCKECDFDLHPECAMREGQWEMPEESEP